MSYLNDIIINKKLYKLVCGWRKTKSDKAKDYKGKIFPYPTKELTWSSQKHFVAKLKDVEKQLLTYPPKIKMEDDEITKCHICGKEITKTKKFNVGKYIWSEKLRHYIKTHNVRPDEIFMDKIWNVVMNSDKLPIKHVRLSRNQLMIIDALIKNIMTETLVD